MELKDGHGRRGFKALGGVRRWTSVALDLILPPESFDDRAGRPLSPGYSASAWTRIAFLDDPVCDGCGLPFPYAQIEGVRCPACTARPRAFARARAACLYDEHSRELILQLKHADRPEIGVLFARWLSRAAGPLLAEVDAVAPVPLHPTRLFARRYNQAAEIARPLCRLTRKPYLPDALVRRRATATQGGRSGRGRRLNVKGAFEVPPGRCSRVQGRRILLVDDVLTTGATGEACAKALLAAGAKAVDLAVVARVREAADLLYDPARSSRDERRTAMPPVTIYTKPFCPYCSRALKLLRDKGVAFDEIDDAAFDANKKRAMIQLTGGGSTFPQIFIGERHVGGCDDMMKLERTGELDKLLAA